MKRTIACLLLFTGLLSSAFSQTVSIQYIATSPQQSFAASKLQEALLKKGYAVRRPKAEYTISFAIDPKQLVNEAYTVAAKGKAIMITGGDERGLIYGSLSVAEDLNNGVLLQKIRARQEKPKLAMRAIKFDLPWDTYRHSYSLDQHGTICKDSLYWKAFLDMMVANRFNSLSVWNLHPYTYMIKPANFPEASPWNDKEMKEWEALFHAIFRMAKERAIDTYVVPFNIFVTPEFAKAHNVAMDNLRHDFFVRGDTSEIVKRYTRECVTQLLNEYPDLTGIGLTLGEGMAGMTPQQREIWMRETIITGMRNANRKSKLIHRIPFSSTTGSLGITSVETEKLTRKSIEEEADLGFTDGPIWADLKFNWSHAHSTTKLIKVHGGKLYDTYFNPVPAKYKITWTARNEDFFCLRWGVPDFVRQHVLRKIHLPMSAVTLSVRKRIYLRKIILPKTVLIFPGNMPLNGNGFFIRYGEECCTILKHPMRYSKPNLYDGMENRGRIYWKPHHWPAPRLSGLVRSLILPGTLHFTAKE